MAELLKNELNIEVRDGEVFSTRTIADKQSYNEFIAIVDKTEGDLTFMQEAVNNFDDAVTEQKRAMKLDFANRRVLKDFDKAWEQHHLGMMSQKKAWEEKEIPNILSEIDILKKARAEAIAAMTSGKK